MNTTLYVVAMWMLLQLLFVWFCARLGEVRDLDMADYRELEARLARFGLDVHTDEPKAPSRPRRTPTRSSPTSRSCSSVTVPPCGRSKNPGASPPRSDRLCAAAPIRVAAYDCGGLNT